MACDPMSQFQQNPRSRTDCGQTETPRQWSQSRSEDLPDEQSFYAPELGETGIKSDNRNRSYEREED
jgi:hypothetical protein